MTGAHVGTNQCRENSWHHPATKKSDDSVFRSTDTVEGRKYLEHGETTPRKGLTCLATEGQSREFLTTIDVATHGDVK